MFSKLNLISWKRKKRTSFVPNFKLWFKHLPTQGGSNVRAILAGSQFTSRIMRLKTIHKKIDIWSPWMFPNVTYWALKLVRLTENSQSMFFDPIFLSYSALKNMFILVISLRNMCNKFAYHFDVAGKSSANQTLQLLYLLNKWSSRLVSFCAHNTSTSERLPFMIFRAEFVVNWRDKTQLHIRFNTRLLKINSLDY